MQNQVTSEFTELSAGCEVCGNPSYPWYFVPDIYLKVKMDDPKQGKAFDRRVLHRFCQAHTRPGKVVLEREGRAAYFARLQATEGAEI